MRGGLGLSGETQPFTSVRRRISPAAQTCLDILSVRFNTPTMKFESSGNAVYSLKYHIILVVKYRRRAFVRKVILDRLRQIADGIGESQGVTIEEMNGEADHVHFLISTKPRTEPCQFINSLKSATSRVLKKEFPEVANAVWNKETLWSPSYFICTVGVAPIEVLRQYIEQQKAPEAH